MKRREDAGKFWAGHLNAGVSLGSLRIPAGNKLENLKGDRQGQYSIRINE
jgi:proteic killer suppression protein